MEGNEWKQNIATYDMKMMKPFTSYANLKSYQVTSCAKLRNEQGSYLVISMCSPRALLQHQSKCRRC